MRHSDNIDNIDNQDIPDASARQKALDTSKSFIVQAPAGSGKTELLSMRVLALLAKCEQPEDILAITFTRKAVAEMRTRIVDSLKQAKGIQRTYPKGDSLNGYIEGLSPHKQLNFRLASDVLNRDLELEWKLLDNPNRLQIRTIDSFNASLVSQLPVSSYFGGQIKVIDDPNELYLSASEKLIQTIPQDKPWTPALSRVFLHLDNNVERLKTLLCSMLQRRDQWIDIVNEANNSSDDQTGRQKAIGEHMGIAVEEILNDNLRLFTEKNDLSFIEALLPLMSVASENSPDPEIKKLSSYNLEDPERNFQKELSFWKSLTALLLTKDNKWRQRITVKEGFPAPTSAKHAEDKATLKSNKDKMLAILEDLRERDNLLDGFAKLLILPDANFTEEELSITIDILEILNILIALLQLEFQEHSLVDHCEMALRANLSLRSDESYSDKQLILDYRIQHILLDEFQDTSNIQLELLNLLTQEWHNNYSEAADGKTLFLVGDPMQSIYRFREANVGIFINTQRLGIGNLVLENLLLETNFRSNPDLIKWINQTFSLSFPALDHIEDGAVSFKSAKSPLGPAHDIGANNVRCFIEPKLEDHDERIEAKHIAGEIAKIKQESPEDSIAILLRKRNQASELLRALKEENIKYEAVDIDSLNKRASINDLFCLCSALIHLGDNIAWAALLRSPLIGFDLKDLLQISHFDNGNNQIIYFKLLQEELAQQLSQDGQQILNRVMPILSSAVTQSENKPFSLNIETTWLNLGGPCVIEANENTDIERFFKLLRDLQIKGTNISKKNLEDALSKLYAQDEIDDSNAVKVLTIHKSKGLEYDHIFIPGMDMTSGNDDKSILNWDIYSNNFNENYLLLSPLAKTGSDEYPLYTYLQSLEKTKTRNELVRLLYVACTRAKKSINLYAQLRINAETQTPETNNAPDKSQLRAPDSRSLLSLIWPHIEKFEFLHPKAKDTVDYLQSEHQEQFRISKNWENPLLLDKDIKSLTTKEQEVTEPFEGRTTKLNIPENIYEDIDTKRLVGTTVHKTLKLFSKYPTEEWENHFNTDSIKDVWAKQLMNLGLYDPTKIKQACQQIQDILTAVFEDTKQHWLFSPKLEQAASELNISSYENEILKTSIVDRTFIKDDVRWIIDYKTSFPKADQTIKDFLKEEEITYSPQLHRYSAQFKDMESLEQTLALYFPLIGVLHKIDH